LGTGTFSSGGRKGVVRVGRKEHVMRRRTGTFVLLAALLLTASVRAHHNMSAAFDFNDRVSLTGTLTKVDWRNPHIYLVLDVKGEGDQVEAWSIEGRSPGFFRARDISSDD